MEAVESVIERDIGAQEQLRVFAQRKLKNGTEVNYALLAELLTAKNSRKLLIDILKKELSFDSLQSSEQLYKVASFFNISTDSLISKDKKGLLNEVFRTRNIIVHQMDVDLKEDEIKYFEHNIDEVTCFFKTIDSVAQNFINEVNVTLAKRITRDFAPLISVENEILTIDF